MGGLEPSGLLRYYGIATTTDYTMTQVAGSFPFLSMPTLKIYSTRIFSFPSSMPNTTTRSLEPQLLYNATNDARYTPWGLGPVPPCYTI